MVFKFSGKTRRFEDNSASRVMVHTCPFGHVAEDLAF